MVASGPAALLLLTRYAAPSLVAWEKAAITQAPGMNPGDHFPMPMCQWGFVCME